MVVAMRWRMRKSVVPPAPVPAKLLARAPAPPMSMHIVPLSPLDAPAATKMPCAAKVPGLEMVLPVMMAWIVALPEVCLTSMPLALEYCLMVLLVTTAFSELLLMAKMLMPSPCDDPESTVPAVPMMLLFRVPWICEELLESSVMADDTAPVMLLWEIVRGTLAVPPGLMVSEAPASVRP